MIQLLITALLAGIAAASSTGGGSSSSNEPSSANIPEPDTSSDDNDTAIAKPVAQPTAQPTSSPVAPAETTAQPTAPTAEAARPEAPVAQAPKPILVQVDSPATMEADAPVATSTQSVEVMTGRVSTVKVPSDNVQSIEILTQPEAGHVSVNPDNSLALVMSHTNKTGAMSFEYRVTHTDGSTEVVTTNMDVTKGAQADGWGKGNSYMLATDDNDKVIVETGENHRDVFVSGSDKALSLEDIAARENMKPEDITGKWLSQHPEYGGTADMAVDATVGARLWSTISQGKNSNWLQFEKGYEYEWDRTILHLHATGEDELHPIHITSYGEGEKPVITNTVSSNGAITENVVFTDIAFKGGLRLLSGDNFLLEDVTFTGTDGLVAQDVSGLTVRDSEFVDIIRETPRTDTGRWEGMPDRVSGIYVTKSDSVLIENSFFDHIGWADNYMQNMSTEGGQAPSMFSHNIYLQRNLSDVTLRDNVIMRGASVGAQVRSGGFIEDNVFIDNNVGFNTLGGGEEATGNYSLVTDNLVTSAGYRTVDGFNGAVARGVDSTGELSTLTDNIIAHMVDPNNPDEWAYKLNENRALLSENAYFDDTIVHNWLGTNDIARGENHNQNTNGLTPETLNATTIQNYAAKLLGKPDATIEDLANYLREHTISDVSNVSNADLIIAYFQKGFGIKTPEARSDAETLRFVPNDLGDGIRWDNRLNWNTKDLPGATDGDSVDLGGNWVEYGGTTTLNSVEMGSGGRLNVDHGKLTAKTLSVGENGGRIDVDGAGQVWVENYSDTDRLDVNVDGGRFANSGDMAGNFDLAAKDGQVLLATDGAMTLSNGSRVEIAGDDAKVGFDGENGDTAVLDMKGGTLSFTADKDGLGSITEVESGHFLASNVQSGAHLGGTLEIDVTEISGQAGVHVLMDVDELVGQFDTIKIVGQAANQDAVLLVDYENDSVVLEMRAAGQGEGMLELQTLGAPQDAQKASELWDALTENHQVLDETLDPDDVEVTVDVLPV